MEPCKYGKMVEAKTLKSQKAMEGRTPSRTFTHRIGVQLQTMVKKIKCDNCGKTANYIVEGNVSGFVKAVYDQSGNFVELLKSSIYFADKEFRVSCEKCGAEITSVKFSGGTPVFGLN